LKYKDFPAATNSFKACHTSTGKEIFITVSIGIAVFNPDADESVESGAIVKKYYVACDKAMYEAKQAGRNQTYCLDKPLLVS